MPRQFDLVASLALGAASLAGFGRAGCSTGGILRAGGQGRSRGGGDMEQRSGPEPETVHSRPAEWAGCA